VHFESTCLVDATTDALNVDDPGVSAFACSVGSHVHGRASVEIQRDADALSVVHHDAADKTAVWDFRCSTGSSLVHDAFLSDAGVVSDLGIQSTPSVVSVCAQRDTDASSVVHLDAADQSVISDSVHSVGKELHLNSTAADAPCCDTVSGTLDASSVLLISQVPDIVRGISDPIFSRLEQLLHLLESLEARVEGLEQKHRETGTSDDIACTLAARFEQHLSKIEALELRIDSLAKHLTEFDTRSTTSAASASNDPFEFLLRCKHFSMKRYSFRKSSNTADYLLHVPRTGMKRYKFTTGSEITRFSASLHAAAGKHCEQASTMSHHCFACNAEVRNRRCMSCGNCIFVDLCPKCRCELVLHCDFEVCIDCMGLNASLLHDNKPSCEDPSQLSRGSGIGDAFMAPLGSGSSSSWM
jgi:hypothetical protein